MTGAPASSTMPQTVPTSIEDLVPNQQTVIALGDDGTLKRLDQFGGRGSARETPRQYVTCNVRDLLLLFTAQGSCFGVPVHRIGATARRSEHGVAIASLIDLAEGDQVIAIIPASQNLAPFLVFATAQGQVKRTASNEFLSARAAPMQALRLDEGDTLVQVEAANEGAELLIHTTQGKAIRFSSQDVRPTGRVAGGVRAVRLDEGDRVLPGTLVVQGGAILVLTSLGFGRRTPIAEYPLQGRDGAGVKVMRLTDKTGDLVGVLAVEDRTSLEGLDGSGRLVLIEAKEVPLQDRQRGGVQIAEGLQRAVVLPRR